MPKNPSSTSTGNGTRNLMPVSVFDHGLLYGDGVFEGIRVYDGVIFQFKEHLDRLYSSAKSIKLVVTRGVGDVGRPPQMP